MKTVTIKIKLVMPTNANKPFEFSQVKDPLSPPGNEQVYLPPSLQRSPHIFPTAVRAPGIVIYFLESHESKILKDFSCQQLPAPIFNFIPDPELILAIKWEWLKQRSTRKPGQTLVISLSQRVLLGHCSFQVPIKAPESDPTSQKCSVETL